ncbi:MAG: hypothetical protein CUN54_03685 [Phototrophicales bacterium]|nr:MAG: hypothetical protein CUN54_03685 [Phototrophicales bacterium]
MLTEILLDLLDLINEILTAAIVIVATSLLLYNLTRNLKNRVARTSGILLACVTATFIGDVFISLQPNLDAFEIILRLQWIGIAFVPAATFHLSDALLATTGLPSRGRRTRAVRLLYVTGGLFLLMAAFTDELIKTVPYSERVSLEAGSIFFVYIAYFLVADGVALFNVQRARQRCLTRDTRRRMGYLQAAVLTPALGIFPYSVLLGPGQEVSLAALLLVNIANFVVIMMLLFLAYPLSFFGSHVPDRVVKTELLNFILRGPMTALLVLVVIILTTQATLVVGLKGQSFMLFATVATVLLWQWAIAIGLPTLERKLIYFDEDNNQISKLDSLSRRLLTLTDLTQLLEAILASSCDYLRVNTAFVVAFRQQQPEIIASIGASLPTEEWLQEQVETLQTLLHLENQKGRLLIHEWHSYWIVPLYSTRLGNEETKYPAGFMSIQARSPQIDLSKDEYDVFANYVRRVSQTLDDIIIQSEIYGILEGLLPQITTTRSRADELGYRHGYDPIVFKSNGIQDRDQFIEQVRSALRHYWGGPGLSNSRLIELHVVQQALEDNDNNPVKTLRAILQAAIENLRPEGERKFTTPEWTLYNILQMRFIESQKVRTVARRLAISEADLYRKQRIAIEAVADNIIETEQALTKSTQS